MTAPELNDQLVDEDVLEQLGHLCREGLIAQVPTNILGELVRVYDKLYWDEQTRRRMRDESDMAFAMVTVPGDFGPTPAPTPESSPDPKSPGAR